jgi:hypothetical protein
MSDEQRDPVPYERFAAVTAEKNALKEEIGPLRERAAGLDAAIRERDAARAELATATAGFADRTALYRAGVDDDEGQDVARALYARLPQDSRPASLGDWLTGLRAEGASVPRALAPYLRQPAAPAAATPAPGAQAAAAPRPAAPAASPPPAAGRVDEIALRAAREKARKTGDWNDFKQLVGLDGAWKA